MPEPGSPEGPRAFPTTHWSVVLASAGRGSPEAEAALAALCSSYWYPLYAYARRQGEDAERAADLVQGFFARLVERDFLSQANPDKGRFRTFLLACLRHCLSNERDRERAAKRGGGRTPVPLDFERAEARYRTEPAYELTAEKLYHRRWALDLLQQVLDRLRAEYAGRDGERLFDGLKPFITAGEDPASCREVAFALGMTEGAVKVAVHRLRRRYGEALRAEIARTLDDPARIDEEIRDLFAALAGSGDHRS